nr:Ig-like domain repeat protein [Acidisarcina polymorpha]
MAVDSSGDAYITGATSGGLPVTGNAFLKTLPNSTSSAFAMKFNPAGSALVYSTYLGGSSAGDSPDDQGSATAVDGAGHAYVAGCTRQTHFPTTPGALQTVNKASTGNNAFVSKLNEDGSGLDYSTYLGGTASATSGSKADCINAIAVDSAENAYVAGVAGSSDFPVTDGAVQARDLNSEFTGFVSKLNPAGSALVFSTYLGGSNFEEVTSIGIDAGLHVFVAGFTSSLDFPVTPGAFQRTNNCSLDPPGPCRPGTTNAFFTELKSDASSLIYSTYLGGHPSPDPGVPSAGAYGLAIGAAGEEVVAGATYAADFPVTAKAFQKQNKALDLVSSGGFTDNAFVTKFAEQPSSPLATTTTLSADPNPQKANTAITLLANVSADDGFGFLSGGVTFSVDGTQVDSTSLIGLTGVAVAYVNLAPGSHNIIAKYRGSTIYSPSTSATLKETVSSTASAPVALPLPGTYRKSQQVNLTSPSVGAAIYYTTNGAPPTQSSTKYAGPITVSSSETIKAIAVPSGGTPSTVTVAAYDIDTAAIVDQFITLVSSANPSAFGQPVTFTATVTAASGPAPTGSVVFLHGTGTLGSAPLVSHGSYSTAAFTTSALTPLGHSITVVYTGNATHTETSSPVLTQEVTP